MNEQIETDELLRQAVRAWLKAHDRPHPREIPGDLVVVAHFRSWEPDETQVDDYEVIVPAGVSYHAAYGLLSHGIDTHATLEEELADGDS